MLRQSWLVTWAFDSRGHYVYRNARDCNGFDFLFVHQSVTFFFFSFNENSIDFLNYLPFFIFVNHTIFDYSWLKVWSLGVSKAFLFAQLAEGNDFDAINITKWYIWRLINEVLYYHITHWPYVSAMAIRRSEITFSSRIVGGSKGKRGKYRAFCCECNSRRAGNNKTNTCTQR